MSGFSRTEGVAEGEVVRIAPHQAEARYFGGNWPAFWRRLTTRRALPRLNDDQLRDIGLTRAEVEREASLPFWRL